MTHLNLLSTSFLIWQRYSMEMIVNSHNDWRTYCQQKSIINFKWFIFQIRNYICWHLTGYPMVLPWRSMLNNLSLKKISMKAYNLLPETHFFFFLISVVKCEVKEVIWWEMLSRGRSDHIYKSNCFTDRFILELICY